MTILTKEKMVGYGPFVDFLERAPGQQDRHIVGLADSLLDVYCNVANRYLPFDPYLGGELRVYETRRLARELFQWSAQIADCRLDARDISPLMELYVPSRPVDHSTYEAALNSLRRDLVDTSTFLATELLAVAGAGNTLVIDGI